MERLLALNFNEEEMLFLRGRLPQLKANWENRTAEESNALALNIKSLEDRLGRLTDAYIDRLIEKDIFEERKASLLMEHKELEERLATLKDGSHSIPDRLQEFLELAGSAYLLYKTGLNEEKRDLLRIVTSNRQVSGKNIGITLALPFNEVADRFESSNGVPYRDRPRTLDLMIDKLWKWFTTNTAPALGANPDRSLNDSDSDANSKEGGLAA